MASHDKAYHVVLTSDRERQILRLLGGQLHSLLPFSLIPVSSILSVYRMQKLINTKEWCRSDLHPLPASLRGYRELWFVGILQGGRGARESEVASSFAIIIFFSLGILPANINLEREIRYDR